MEELARLLREILDRLDQLEARSVMSYAKSTYTPTYLGGATAGVTTYTTQVGFYTKIGRVVFFHGLVVWTAATGTGQARVSLPFTTVNTANAYGAGSLRADFITFANGSLQMLIPPGVAYFTMESPASNAALTGVNVEAAGSLVFSGWFEVV